MKTKIFIFFALVSVFPAFADSVSDCLEQKQVAYNYVMAAESANQVTARTATSIIGNSNDQTIIGLALGQLNSIGVVDDKLQNIRSAIDQISCNASNETCSVDLEPLVSVCSNIYDVVVSQYVVMTNCEYFLTYIWSDVNTLASALSPNNANSFVGDPFFNPDFWVNVKYPELLAAVSNFNDNVSSSFDSLTNQVSYFNSNFDSFVLDLGASLSVLFNELLNQTNLLRRLFASIDQYFHYLEYLQYLEGISQDISYLSTNEYFNVNVLNLTNYFAIKSANVGATMPGSFYRFSSFGTVTEQASINPYNSPSSLRRSNVAETIQGGFVNLLSATASLNNYFYWLMQYLGTNKTDYSEITIGLANLTNILNRVDGYVLGDFSNQFYHVFESIDTLVSNSLEKVDYTTNLVEIASLLQTSTNHLASIDSKLDVLDYIKVLSDTPLSDFSGDSYYDYLTNLYLNGASSAPSTNWFERIEILLASMVFGDSGASTISNEVEFTNFSEESIENAFNDYTFQNELNSGIDLVENTGENFLTILRGFHDSLSSVSQPQSISIGIIGGENSKDTATYQDVMHYHFQVSFNSCDADSFTLVVRSMTTIIWILVTMMFVYFSARWLLSKVLFFYRLMRTLITSLFLK